MVGVGCADPIFLGGQSRGKGVATGNDENLRLGARVAQQGRRKIGENFDC